MRRSVSVVRDMKAGEVLKLEDLDAKRPGTGIAADKLDELVGKKLLVDKEADTLLQEEEIE